MPAFWWLAMAMTAQLAEVQAELERALRAKYPHVTRFELAALDDERAERLRPGGPIARLGARSAVAGEDGRLAWFAVRGYSVVAVVTRPLAARTELAADDLALEERDVIGLGCTPLQTTELDGAQRLRRGARAGDVLCTDAFEPKPPVVRGADVAVVYSGGRVQLRTTARAEQDARLGEPVAVRNLRSGDAYWAVVSGNNEVTVDE